MTPVNETNEPHTAPSIASTEQPTRRNIATYCGPLGFSLYLRQPLRYLCRMKMEAHGETLHVSGLAELDAANSTDVCNRIRGALHATQKNVELDLAQTSYIDSCGLGTLIALHKTACSRGGSVRLLNPQPAVQEVLKLTRLGRIFDISKG